MVIGLLNVTVSSDAGFFPINIFLVKVMQCGNTMTKNNNAQELLTY